MFTKSKISEVVFLILHNAKTMPILLKNKYFINVAEI